MGIGWEEITNIWWDWKKRMDVPAPIYFDQGAQIAVAEIELSTSANQSRPKKKIQKRGKKVDNRNIPILVLSSLLKCATELKHFSQQSRPFLGPQEECDRGKKTLVLDLDQTLVVASYTSQGDHDFTVDNSPFGVFYMHKRPGLDTFLRTVAQRFEIVVYTAATSDYADEVLDAIDKDCMVRWQLSREHCSPIAGSPQYRKDLHRLGRPLSSCIMIDDVPEYVEPRENALFIEQYTERNPNDRVLLDMLPMLMALEREANVRDRLVAFDRRLRRLC